jgi:hypothetical protein
MTGICKFGNNTSAHKKQVEFRSHFSGKKIASYGAGKYSKSNSMLDGSYKNKIINNLHCKIFPVMVALNNIIASAVIRFNIEMCFAK